MSGDDLRTLFLRHVCQTSAMPLGLDRLDDHRGRAAVDGPERGFVVEGDEGHVGE